MKIRIPAFVLALLLLAGLPLASSSAYVAVSVGIAPPAIPVYEQPLCPVPGYIWIPGFWAWGPLGYYWVPGYWSAPPRVGLLWTPGYWSFGGRGYFFHEGYWGPTVGFYGGINYGYGYWGSGYYGGEWVGNTFRYNTAVSRVNTKIITNTYVNRAVLSKRATNRAGFNGKGGVQAQPTAQEQAAARAEHIAPTETQRSRVQAAKNDPALQAKNNKGKPRAEAVRTFSRKHAAQPEVAAGAEAARPAARHPGREAAAPKAKPARTTTAAPAAARTSERARRPQETARTRPAKAAPPKRNVEPARVTRAPRREQLPQHRARIVKGSPGAPGHGPGASQQSPKKKKKNEKQKPGEGQ